LYVQTTTLTFMGGASSHRNSLCLASMSWKVGRLMSSVRAARLMLPRLRGSVESANDDAHVHIIHLDRDQTSTVRSGVLSNRKGRLRPESRHSAPGGF